MRKYFWLIGLVIWGAGSAMADAPAQWIIDPAQSHLTFDGTVMNMPFTGEFKKFRGDIIFDPVNLAQSRAAVTVDMASETVNDKDAAEYITTKDWFDIAEFPEAKFETVNFTATDATHYIAHGKLTLRGAALPLDLPFTLNFSPDKKSVTMQSEVTINRMDFGLGATGDWRDPKTVDPAVKVHVALAARRA